MSIDSFLNKEFSIGKSKVQFHCKDVLLLVTVTILAMLMRYSMFPYESKDYQYFLSKWMEQIREHGGFAGLAVQIGDYAPSYLYMLHTIISFSPFEDLSSIKGVSIVFDLALAAGVFGIVYQQYRNAGRAVLAYTVILFAPTVFLNSAMWGQCDIIYVFFAIMCVYFFSKEKSLLGVISFSISFCFKLQSIFLAPFLLVMWLKGKMKFREFFLIPLIYLISVLPAFLMGRPLKELLLTYAMQADQYKKLSESAPNLYSWMNEGAGQYMGTAAIMICAAAVLTAIYLIYNMKIKMKEETVFALALLFAMIVPFLLPYMHERYFFMADVLSIMYVFFNPKKWWIAAGVSLCSLLSINNYLFKINPVPMEIVALIMLGLIIGLILELRKHENTTCDRP